MLFKLTKWDLLSQHFHYNEMIRKGVSEGCRVDAGRVQIDPEIFMLTSNRPVLTFGISFASDNRDLTVQTVNVTSDRGKAQISR